MNRKEWLREGKCRAHENVKATQQSPVRGAMLLETVRACRGYEHADFESEKATIACTGCDSA